MKQFKNKFIGFKRNIEEMNKYIDKMPHHVIIDPAEYKERFGFDWLYEQDIVEILDKRIEEKHDLIKWYSMSAHFVIVRNGSSHIL